VSLDRVRGTASAPTARNIAGQVALVVLAAAAGLAVAPAFGARLTLDDLAPGGIVAAVAVGALAPAVGVTVARFLGLEALVAVAVGLVGGGVVIALVTRPGTAVFSGAYQLLTSALPATVDGPARATVAALTGFASLIASMIAAYAKRRALAIAPAFATLLAALALDAGIRQPPAWYAAVVVVPAGAALALLRRPVVHGGDGGDRRMQTVRATFPLVGAAAILAAGAMLATVVGSGSRLPAVRQDAADARDLVAAPIKPRNAVEPMLQYPALANNVLQVRFAGIASRRIDMLTLVTLDEFTGQTWTTHAGYRRAGTRLADDDPARPVSIRMRVITPGALSWLLRPERPTSIDRADLGTNEATGDIAVPVGVPYPLGYRITGSAPTVPFAALRPEPVTPLHGPVASAARAVPKTIVQAAKQFAATGTDYVRLLTLSNRLRGDGYFVDTGENAPAGNGFAQIQALLTAPNKHVGTSEQYASAFAILARMMGYQSRLVLGFEPRYGKHGNGFTVTGADVHAWPQVHFNRSGWITFDPTPTRESSRARDRDQPQANPRPSAAASQPTPRPSAPNPSTSPRTNQADDASGTRTATWLGVAGLLLLLIVLVGSPAGKAGRRRRRRAAAVPAQAVYGAWRETNDRLSELGSPPPRGRSTHEVADSSPEPVRSSVRALGAILDRAGYAPEAAGPDDARSAWLHHDHAARTLRTGQKPLRRILAALDPRPLWRR